MTGNVDTYLVVREMEGEPDTLATSSVDNEETGEMNHLQQ
jgi:hypothetical protein